MERRHFLATAGVVAGTLAGCLSEASGGGTRTDPATTSEPVSTTSDPPTSPSPDYQVTDVLQMGEALHAGRWVIRVEEACVRPSVLTRGVHVDVHAEERTQFVVVRLTYEERNVTLTPTRTGRPPLPENRRDLTFHLELDGERATDEVVYAYVGDLGRHQTLLAFPVPFDVDPSEGAVVWHNADVRRAAWTLPDDTLSAVATPADLRVRDVTVSDRVAAGGQVRVSITVANVGGRDGRFLSELGDGRLSDQPEVGFDVPAGESVTYETTLTADNVDAGERFPVRFDWGLDSVVKEVQVE